MIPGVLEPYRRHLKSCPHRAEGIGWQRCSCPVWCDGELGGRRYRRSLKTRSWERALDRIALLEGGKVDAGMSPEVTVGRAADAFLADCAARGLAASTVRQYTNTLGHLRKAHGTDPIADVTLDTLTRYRAARKIASTTSRRELEVIRQFFQFAADRGWISGNPARRLRMPRDTSSPTLPFTSSEAEALLAACDALDSNNPAFVEFGRVRARALVLLLVHTGLRISDAAALRRSSVSKGHLTITATQKTGVPIRLLLHPEAQAALRSLPDSHERFFWTSGTLDTCVHKLRRVVARLGEIAGIHAHPHRFRDTFACRLLESGADIRTVSLLLGHRSIKTTEKHYAPFVKSHQALLDSALSRLHGKTA